MSVVREIKDVGPWRKELSIEVPVAAVDAEMERVTHSIRKTAKAPGFRKGKMPLDLVKKRYMEEIRQETLERIVPRFWRQAEAESQLQPLTSPQLGEVEWTDEKFVFAATVEIRPEITIGDLESFDLPEVEAEPTDEEIDEALENIRRQASDWKPVERPAANGDLVTVKIRETDGDEEVRPVMLEVGEQTVWPELSEALAGLEAGKSAPFTRPGDPESGQIVRRHSVELVEVKERILPELDDALAQKVGKFTDLAELRSRVADQLRVGKQREGMAKREAAMLDQLALRHPFDAPQGAVDAEVQEMLTEYATALSEQGVDVEKGDIEWERIAQEFTPRGEGRVRARLLLDAVSDHLELEADPEDLQNAIGQLATERKVSSVAMRKALADSGRLESLRRHLRRRAAVARLLGEVAEDQEPNESADPDTGGTDGGESVIGEEE